MHACILRICLFFIFYHEQFNKVLLQPLNDALAVCSSSSRAMFQRRRNQSSNQLAVSLDNTQTYTLELEIMKKKCSGVFQIERQLNRFFLPFWKTWRNDTLIFVLELHLLLTSLSCWVCCSGLLPRWEGRSRCLLTRVLCTMSSKSSAYEEMKHKRTRE